MVRLSPLEKACANIEVLWRRRLVETRVRLSEKSIDQAASLQRFPFRSGPSSHLSPSLSCVADREHVSVAGDLRDGSRRGAYLLETLCRSSKSARQRLSLTHTLSDFEALQLEKGTEGHKVSGGGQDLTRVASSKLKTTPTRVSLKRRPCTSSPFNVASNLGCFSKKGGSHTCSLSKTIWKKKKTTM